MEFKVSCDIHFSVKYVHWSHFVVIKKHAFSDHIEHPNNSNTKRWFVGLYLIGEHFPTNRFIGIFHGIPFTEKNILGYF